MQVLTQPISSGLADFLRGEIRSAEEEIYRIFRQKGGHDYDEQIEADVRMVTIPAYKILAKMAAEEDDKLAMAELAEGLRFINEKANLDKMSEEVADLLGTIGLLALQRDEISYKIVLKEFKSRGL